jgi:Helicase associated domain
LFDSRAHNKSLDLHPSKQTNSRKYETATNSTAAMEINPSNFFTSASCFDNESRDDSIDPISNGTSMNQQSIDPIHFWSTRTVGLGDAKQAYLPNPFAVICGVNQHSMQDASAAVGTQEVPLLTDIQLPDPPGDKKRSHEYEHYHSLDSPTTSNEEMEDRHQEETAADGTNGAAKKDNNSSKRRKRPRVSQPRLSWEERVEQLKNYKKEHGDLLIPIRYKGNPSLGKFVHNTREQYKLYHKHHQESNNSSGKPKKKCTLSAERIRQLDELGFAWSTERTKHQEEDWEARLQQLRDYKAKHGGKSLR